MLITPPCLDGRGALTQCALILTYCDGTDTGAVYIDIDTVVQYILIVVLRRLLAFCVLTTYSYYTLLLPAAEEWSATAKVVSNVQN